MPELPDESSETEIAFERVNHAIHDWLVSIGVRKPLPTSLSALLGSIRDKDPFLNENPGP